MRTLMTYLLTTVSCIVLAAPLGAQEEDAATPAEPEVPTEDRPADDAEDPADDRPAAPSPESFDPSEEISLDLPVSFPVDI